MAKPTVAGAGSSGRPSGSLRTGPSHRHPLHYPTGSVTHPPGLNCYLSSRSYPHKLPPPEPRHTPAGGKGESFVKDPVRREDQQARWARSLLCR